MFICKKCGEKDVPRRGRRSECKKCEREYQKQWKNSRPEKQQVYNQKSNSSNRVKEIKSQNVQDRQQRRRHIKELCVEYLGGECQYEGGCSSPLRDGLEPCYPAFQFHHVDPTTKIAGVASIINSQLADTMIRQLQIVGDLQKCSQLIAELDKCILLCSNCHHRLEYCDGCERKVAEGKRILADSS